MALVELQSGGKTDRILSPKISNRKKYGLNYQYTNLKGCIFQTMNLLLAVLASDLP